MTRPHVRAAGGKRLVALLSVAASLLVNGCSSGGGPAQPGSTLGPGNPPVAGGTTTFHLVVSDGPKAGTYDISTTDPGACHVADEGYFVASYMDTAKPGLDYIEANKHPTVTGLKYWFDAETTNKTTFVGDGTVTITVDDRGSTATLTAVSDSNLGQVGEERTVIDTGRAELTVQCASVQRPGQ